MSILYLRLAFKSLLTALLFSTLASSSSAQAPGHVRVAVVGLVHGHVQGFLQNLPSHPNVELVGISEPDAALRQRYASRFKLS
jgi:purine nucleoside permease